MKKILTLILIGYSFYFFLSNLYSNRRKRKKNRGVLFYSNNKNMTSNKSGVVDLSKFQEMEWIDVYHISYKRDRIKKENIIIILLIFNQTI